MRNLTILMLFVLLGCSHQNANKSDEKKGASVNDLSFDVTKKILKNGLTILVVENHKLPIFTYYTYYEVGGKHETKGITGATHFLEHMMFKGAKKYGPGMFDKLVEGNGGSNNAYTTNDLTVYYENLPSEHLNSIIDLEADRMENLSLIPESFESERMVVLEERKMRYENSDRGKLYLNMMKNMFAGTPYGTSVIGDIADLKTVTRDQIFAYFKKFYTPNNAVIVIVGDVDADDVIDEIEEKFSKIKANTDLPKIKKEILSQKGFKFKGKYNRSIKLKGTSKTPMFFLAFQGIKVGPRDAYTLDILSSILGDGESSYLSKKYVLNRKPKLTNVYAANYTMQESGVFFIGGQLIKPQNLNWMRKDLFKKIKKVCKGDFSEQAVQKIKNQYLVHMISGLETNSGVAKFLGNREVYYKDYNFYKKEMDIYNSVTKSELVTACNKYLKRNKSLFLSIWHKH